MKKKLPFNVKVGGWGVGFLVQKIVACYLLWYVLKLVILFSNFCQLIFHADAEKLVGVRCDKPKWELTSPVPLLDEGQSMEEIIGKNPDVHYIYVCTRVSDTLHFASLLASEDCSIFMTTYTCFCRMNP